MKRKVFLTGVINILLVLGLMIIGCDTGTNGGSDSTGSITIKNNSNTFRITYVDIFDVETDQSLKRDSDGVDKGKSKTYAIEPGNKIQVYIEDGVDYFTSVQFSLKAGDSKTFTYDGFGLD